MTGTEKLKALIDRGRKGENQGLSIGLPKLERFIDGLTPETYYLIAGGTGSGKTSFVLHSFIYKPLIDNLDNENFHIIYFSLEMTEEQLLAKLLSIYIYETYGVELSFKELLSRGKNSILSDEHYELVLESLDFLDKVELRMTIYDKPLNADRMESYLREQLVKYGSFVGDSFIQKNPSQLILGVVDHIGLCRAAQGRSKKEEMDMISSYSVSFRNKCKMSWAIVMQVNRGSSNVERRKLNFQELQLDDLKGSGNPAEDANIVMALFYPYREKMTSYRGFDIKQLGDNFRSAIVLKNRWGAADLAVGLGFYGKCGLFKELPKANEILDYEKYKTPEWKDCSVTKEIKDTEQDKNLKVTITL